MYRSQWSPCISGRGGGGTIANTRRPGNGGGSTSCPRIISRSEWGARNPTDRTSLRHPVPRVIIHHTVTPACTSLSTCATRVRSIQNYHMNARS